MVKLTFPKPLSTNQIFLGLLYSAKIGMLKFYQNRIITVLQFCYEPFHNCGYFLKSF
jgi:hypothetical protein